MTEQREKDGSTRNIQAINQLLYFIIKLFTNLSSQDIQFYIHYVYNKGTTINDLLGTEKGF